MAAGRRIKGFVNFIFVVAVIGLAVAAARSVAPNPVSPVTSSTTSTPSLRIEDRTPISSTTTTTVRPLELVVLETSAGANRLVSIDLATQARKTLFTDADETQKIRQIGNLTSDGKEALAILSETDDDFGGSLYAIRLDGSGQKTLLAEQFASPWPPIFSPDGKKIAYVYFSNAEAQSGFFLVISNRDGTNRQELVTETQAITQPVFAANGSEIAYFRSGTGGSGSIMAVDTRGGSPRQLATYENRVPYDLAWASDGALAFVDGTGEAASLYELTNASSEPVKLVTPPGAESRPVYSPDAKFLAFTTSLGNSKTITLLDRSTGKTTSLGTGTLVVGWRERGS